MDPLGGYSRYTTRSMTRSNSSTSCTNQLNDIVNTFCMGTFSNIERTSPFFLSLEEQQRIRSAPPNPDEPWRPRNIRTFDTSKKMTSNIEKAIQEQSNDLAKDVQYGRVKAPPNQPFPYASYEEVKTDNTEILHNKMAIGRSVLDCSYLSYTALGDRKTMEDAHFIVETDNYILAGVFDGHQGSYLAKYTRDRLQVLFPSFLDRTKYNEFHAFEQSFYLIQKEIDYLMMRWEEDGPPGRFYCGTTAVAVYIDKWQSLVTIANIGDSQTNIYRRFDGVVKSIPVCRTHHWGRPKEAARAAKAFKDATIKETWPKFNDPKMLRFPNAYGINMSRALGDLSFQGTRSKPGLLPKPKISQLFTKHGDRLILACDGLKDYVSEYDIVNAIANPNQPDITKELTLMALNGMRNQAHGDNITVLCIDIVNSTRIN